MTLRRLLVALLATVALVGTACSSADSSQDEANADLPDPCEIVDTSVLGRYFVDTPVGEMGSAGPISSCSFRDENANSLLIQVAVDYDLYRPDPCRGCVDLTFGDDGYASGSLLQSTATVVIGPNWYSVTTTGFGDDEVSIANLAEELFASRSD